MIKKPFYSFLAITTISLVSIIYLIGLPTFTPKVVILGILFLTALTFTTYTFSERSVNDENPNKFVRMVMGMTMLKFFLCVVGVAIMLLTLRKSLHKPDLYVLMGFYLVFTLGEALFLSKIARK
jgi:hypothetical protein